MRQAKILMKGKPAGILKERENGTYCFAYSEHYKGPPISFTMPVQREIYEYNFFPPFFDGLLPEGPLLEALLRIKKIDRNDLFSQLLAVGTDVVGSVSILPIP